MYAGFGYWEDNEEDPNDCMSIYNARKELIIEPDALPLHRQIRLKRIHDSLTQEQLGKIVQLPTSTISLIETGQRFIPKKRFREFEHYLYESLYVNGERDDSFDFFDQDEPKEPYEMTYEKQRAFWKKIVADDPDLYGTVL